MPQLNVLESEHDDEPVKVESARLARLLLRGIWRPLVVVAIVGLIIVIVQPGRLVSELGEVRGWVDELGVWGILLFLGIYIIAAVAIVPQAMLKVAAGGLFGAVLGVVVASIGSTLGAAACFLIARYVASGSLMHYIRQKRRFRRLDQLTRKHGALIVGLSRLVPILPGNLLNYAFGLTQVPLGTFVLWSWLCMLPGTVVLVVGTDAFVRGIAEGRVPWAMLVVVAAALAMLVCAFIYAHRRFRQMSKSEPDVVAFDEL